jgi:hypothetical protein
MTPILPYRVMLLASTLATSLVSAQVTQPVPVSVSSETAQRFRDLVPLLVRQANLKAGQSVLISGSPAYLPLMEDLAIGFTQSGVATLLDVQTDKLAAARRAGSGGRYGYQPPTALDKELARTIDLHIAFPGPAALPALAPQQQVLVDSSVVAWRKFAHGRRLFINVPTERDTTATGLSFAEVSRYRWNAMQADYSHIAQEGESLRRIFANAKSVHITTPEGTDITFATAPNSGAVDAVASLMNVPPDQAMRAATIPGGSFSANIVSRSANGKIRAPLDQCNTVVHDEAIDVRQGIPENVHAATDEACVQKNIAGLHLNTVIIGLNPALAELAGRSPLALDPGSEGSVGLWFGGNWQYGGNDYSPGIWWVALPKATMTVDGKVVLRDGQFVGAM